MFLEMLLAKLSKLTKYPIFSVLAKQSYSVFIYNVITLLIKLGRNEAQNQQQKYLQCYNSVNIFGRPTLNSPSPLNYLFSVY